MTKAVIFDIDNTLYNYDKAHKTAMAAVGAYTEKNFGMGFEETSELIRRCMDIVLERTGDNCVAFHSRMLRFQCFLEQIGNTDYHKAMEMDHVYWNAFMEVVEPEPGLIPLLLGLKKDGIRIGIGTDMTTYIQYKKLEKLDVLSYPDFIVTSEEAGVEKPAPWFFELCVEKAGCRPEECVFIGDVVEKDVAGPTRCGMTGIWYNPHGRLSEEAAGYPVIKSYEDYYI